MEEDPPNQIPPPEPKKLSTSRMIEKLISRGAYCEYQSKLHHKQYRKYQKCFWFVKILTLASASLVFANSQLIDYMGTQANFIIIIINTILAAFNTAIDFGKWADSAFSASVIFRHIYDDIFDEVSLGEGEGDSKTQRNWELYSQLKSTTKELSWLIQIYPDAFNFRDMEPSKKEKIVNEKRINLQRELDNIRSVLQSRLAEVTEEHRIELDMTKSFRLRETAVDELLDTEGENIPLEELGPTLSTSADLSTTGKK